MQIPEHLRYADTHEWARLEPDGTVAVGITDHAQERLGDLVYVEPPRIGTSYAKGQECGVVESVKAASDVYAPLSGEVVAINEALARSPELINRDAYAAWLFKVKPSDPTQLDALLDAAAYRKVVEAEHE
jgi:glycine cleavage system H protein